MRGITIVGLVAGTLTTVAFLPQLLHTWRSASSKDISLGMISCFVVGVALWLIYGICLGDVPIILANGVTLLLSASILVLKLTQKQ